MGRILVLGALAWALVGCGGDDGGDDDGDNGPVEIASGPLTGKVGGASWTLVSAQTNAFLSEDETFWVDAYAQTLSGCSDFGDGNSLILNVPKRTGTHQFSFALNATFVVQGAETENFVATKGAIRVDEITSTAVRGGVSMTFDANNSVSGEFDAVICAE